MIDPPPHPRHRSPNEPPSWRGIAAAYTLFAAVPALLWAVEHPVSGAVGLGAVVGLAAGLVVGARGLVRLHRCLDRCGECTIDPPGTLRITLTRAAGGTE